MDAARHRPHDPGPLRPAGLSRDGGRHERAFHVKRSRGGRPFHVKRFSAVGLVGLLVAVAALAPGAARAQPPPGSGEDLVMPTRPDVPPPGYTRTARHVMRLAAARPEVRRVRAEHRPAYVRAYVSGRGR